MLKLVKENKNIKKRKIEDKTKGNDPRLIHVNVWQKPLQYCKVISLQLIKINGKKKTKETDK